MKNLGLIILFLLAAVPAYAGPVADAKAHSEAFAKAMNARDAEAMLALYADDAHVIWPGQGEEAKGKAEIKKLIDNNLKAMPADAKVIFKSQEAIVLGKGYIAALGQWEQSFKGPDGKQQTIPFRTSEIIRKQGNTMLYVVDHASVGLPPPPAPTSSSPPTQ